jgi:hypothetical protein
VREFEMMQFAVRQSLYSRSAVRSETVQVYWAQLQHNAADVTNTAIRRFNEDRGRDEILLELPKLKDRKKEE